MKYHDLYMELSIPIIERDLQKRLEIINLLKNTDMWDEKEILDLFGIICISIFGLSFQIISCKTENYKV